MTTLYFTGTGFRFPYSKYTDASTVANLQFLEAQLDEYLHEHSDDGTTLYVTPQGFRTPHKKVKANLGENMRFVEAQLTEHLHEHEVAIGSGLSRDAGFESTSSISIWNDVYGAAWTKKIGNNNGTLSVSSTNPRSGSNHVRCTVTAGDTETFQLYVMGDDPGVVLSQSGITFPNTLAVSAGDKVEAECYVSVVQAPNPTEFRDTFVRFNARWWTSSGTSIDLDNSSFDDVTELNEGEGYRLLSHIFTAPANAAWATITLYVRANNTTGGNVIVDVDDFTSSAITLVTTHQGFRFPYDWEKDGDIMINMKFLETEISKYLHKHEEGV